MGRQVLKASAQFVNNVFYSLGSIKKNAGFCVSLHESVAGFSPIPVCKIL